METLWLDLRYALRALRKGPGFTAVAVLTLALGIGANTAIFSVVQNVLLRPLPYPQPESLVEIWNTYPPMLPQGGLSPGDYADWRRENASFSSMGAYAQVSTGFNLTGEGDAQRVLVAYASSDVFSMLGVQMVAGRSFLPEEDRAGNAPVVILTSRLWRSHFGGDPGVVGRTIALDNRRYTVAGILTPSFNFLRWPDLWMPVGQFDDDLTEHIHHAFVGIARLKPGLTLAQARDEIGRLNQQEALAYPDSHKNFGVLVQPMQDPAAGKLRTTLLVLSGAVGLVLLIACANIVNLLLVRNTAREREVAVRAALGAKPWQLVRQLLTESTLLSLCGGIIGVLFAFVGLRALMAFVPADLVILHETGLNGWVLGFTILVCLATGTVCALLPALRMLKSDLAGALKQGSKGVGSSGHHRAHNLLVISEIAMALIPLTGTGLLQRSFQHLIEVDPGFRTDHLLTMEVQQAGISFAQSSQLPGEAQLKLGQKQSLQFQQIADQIRDLPGVKEVGGVSVLPLGTEFRSASRFVIEGQPAMAAGARPIAQTRVVAIGYFAALGIPLRTGRLFQAEDWKLQDNIVISEAMERRFWPDGDALGKRVNFCSLDPKPCWFSVIGVVGNVHQFGLDGEPTFDTYLVGGWTPYVVVRTASDPVALAPAISSLVRKADPNLPVSHVVTMEELLSDSVSPRRFSVVLTTIFAFLALLLAAAGIYGVMSYTVSTRTQEIGLRVALGAQPDSVQNMILGKSLKLTVAGVGLGLVGSFALMRFLSSLLFGVGAYDASTFFSVTVLLMAVALAASYIPARRAVRVDPLVALRHE
ncbi:MAG TPA: ABC transporter permease [Candidatus Acidoferrum sp.]|nr:ABC transporter permease [Candidatus Acidoferrum sp.]